MPNIRNFSIIAHIDHGKSTLADRLLEITHTVEQRQMKDQVLDQMELERERGITIKLQPVRMTFQQNNQTYILNLIDTPGHVDFSYEVSRSLQACEGALLIVDATQGIQAQTLANLYLALEQNLAIIPIINKIDLPAADVTGVTAEIVNLLGCAEKEIIPVSAKTGQNVPAILEAIVRHIPAPPGQKDAPLRALIFDSVFDDYQGVIAYVRVVDGELRRNDPILLMANNKKSETLGVGFFRPQFVPQQVIKTGEIGYVITGFKGVQDARVGDTITLQSNPANTPLPGYKDVKPMVFAGIYAKDSAQYPLLREAIGRLKLNDAALIYEPDHSPALGFGFRCGFLGLLHLDIIAERLQREFAVEVLVTTPSVAYKILRSNGQEQTISSPLDLPDPTEIDQIKEPIMLVDIVTPIEYIGAIMQLVTKKRGRPGESGMEYLDEKRVILHYRLPLAGIVVDFYDSLKNATSGYASLNYEFAGYAAADIVRLDILVAEERVEPLASMVYRDETHRVGGKVVNSLKEILPRQMFEVKIQAAIGGKVIASAKIPPMRKDVTAKLYGGDVTRKRKLLEKQKKGKKKMKTIGKVDIPQAAFMAILKR